ncbi:MAG: M1 family metallopeptidase [bacterium]|nr:M1 family metallopeptidase [bacterium]
MLLACAAGTLGAQQPTAGQQKPRVLPYPIDLPASYVAAVEAGTRTMDGRPGAKHWTNSAHYDIAMELDVENKRVIGKAVMTYHNRSPKALRQLIVHLRQNMMKPGMQRTRTIRTTAGLELGEVALDGEALGRRARTRDTRLYVRLPKSLQPGEKTTLSIDYSYEVPKAGTAPRNGHEDDDVFYLAYWYPQFAVYDDVAGWVADPYKGNGEFYMGYADYDLAITAPSGYLVRATGELTNAKEVLRPAAIKALAKARKSRDIVPVISREDLEAGKVTKPGKKKLTWKFHAENVRDTAVSIARTYVWDATHAVVKDKHGSGKDGVAMIHSVYEPNARAWRRSAEYARHTIEYMSEMVFPYPWPQMTACEGIIGGGMEFPMMTIVGQRGSAGTIAHELIHMWFPMIVGSNEKRYAWQDEGFTSFWTTLCRDDFQDRTVGPKSAVMGFGAAVRRGLDVVCMRHADTYGTDSFGFASYSKPAAVLHQLRGMLGDDTFFGAFRRYTRDWAYKHPMPYDFFHAFSDHAGQDLEPYFRTWFFEKWPLDHAVGKVTTGKSKTTVIVEDRGRAMHPCVVEATMVDDSTARQTVDAAHWRGNRYAKVQFPGQVKKVVIDPDIQALDKDRRNNSWEAEGDSAKKSAGKDKKRVDR